MKSARLTTRSTRARAAAFVRSRNAIVEGHPVLEAGGLAIAPAQSCPLAGPCPPRFPWRPTRSTTRSRRSRRKFDEIFGEKRLALRTVECDFVGIPVGVLEDVVDLRLAAQPHRLLHFGAICGILAFGGGRRSRRDRGAARRIRGCAWRGRTRGGGERNQSLDLLRSPRGGIRLLWERESGADAEGRACDGRTDQESHWAHTHGNST